MSLKLYFNPKSLESLAKELRRASWGVSVVAVGGGFKLDSIWILLTGGATWLILQITAVVLESIKDESYIMNLELGLIITFAIIALGGVGLAGFVLWLRNRDSVVNHNHDGIKHA